MRTAAFRLLRAELRSRPLQAALTGLVAAVAVGALLVTLHLRAQLDAPFDRLMRATNGPHVTVVGRSPDAVAAVGRLPGVADADAARPVVDAPAVLHGARARLAIVGVPAGGVRVDHPLLLRGRNLQRPGEVVLAPPVADEEGFRPGSQVVLGEGTERRTLRVVGIAATVRFGLAGWAAPADVRSLASKAAPLQTAVELRLSDPSQADEFIDRAARTEHGGDLRFFDWQRDRAELTDNTRRGLAIMQASTLLALFAAAFTLATAITGRVLAQRRHLGLLRAVGMTPAQVTLVLLAHYLALVALAAPFGLLAGALVSPGLLGTTAESLGARAPGAPGPGLMLAAVAIAAAVVAAATALPAWRAGRGSATQALAIGRGASSARASRVARLARRLRLPVVVGLGAKDAFSQRGRTAMTVGSLALAVTLVGTAMGFEATIDRLSRDSALRAQPYDVRVDTAELPAAAVDRMLAARRDVAAVARIHEVPMTARDGATEIHVRIVDGPAARFPYAIKDGRAALAAGEVTLGRGSLDALHAHIGDRISLRAAGRQVSLRVVGRHVEPDDEGRGAVAPRAGFPASVVGVDESPYWGVQVRTGADPAAVAAAIRHDSGGKLDAERPVESLRREAADMRPVIYGTGGLLVLIAFVNLLTTLLLAVRERERDFAILASTGATPRQVLATVVAGGSSLALPAALLGLPFGAALFFTMIGITDPADGPDVRSLPAWWWYPLVVPAALALTALVSTLAARQAARVRPALALRAE